jgi:tetratricopeptide (TPR) repeat protein
MEKPKQNQPRDPKAAPKASTPPGPPAAPAKTPPTKVPPMFRTVDWLTMALTFGIIWAVYLFMLAPEQTLEDSGELCTGAYYAGIPHPPGYPFWSVYAWFWTAILPFYNVAWRVEVGESFAAAMGCGLLALMVSRGSSMLIEGIEVIRDLPKKWENAICSVSGFVAGTLLGLDAFMWSESVVINRISLFGVPWLIAVLACLMRWMYAPQQGRYLYLAMFLYGLCATIHQSLLLSAMGVEVLIAFANPRLGRDLFIWNSVIFLGGLVLRATQSIPALNTMSSIEVVLFYIVGIGSLAGASWLIMETRGFLSEWKSTVLMGVAWAAGVCVYFYEPLSGMTDPPMQWGYPRTVEGFFHALSRGQYEGIHGTADFGKFLFQLWYIAQGLMESFSWVYIFIGLLPFAFLFKMHKRERSWILGLTSIYFCLSVLLVILIDVSPDRSSTDLNKVFFTASHGLFAMMIGYGLTLMAAYTATHYKKIRVWGFAVSAVAVVLAISSLKDAAGTLYRGPAGVVSLSELPHHIALAFDKYQYGLPIFANLILLAIPLCLIIAFLLYRQRGPVFIMLALFCIMPTWSGLSHWYKSEQRNHWFGYWFGHDMFTPPFTDPKTKKLTYDNDLRAALLKDPANATLVYPEMDRNTILFGGTDPGRFCPTYAIFCDSFIPHSCQPKQDQKFDRRDCYLITQNALADGTYLDYLRAQYNRSKQIDPPFFRELLAQWWWAFIGLAAAVSGLWILCSYVQGTAQRNRDAIIIGSVWAVGFIIVIAQGVGPVEGISQAGYNLLDRPFTAWGAYVEKYRRARGVYPPSEIYIPSPDDSQRCFEEYTEDVARRQQLNQLEPGEDVTIQNGHVQVSGQVAVMNINGLLCKVIFDNNPTNSFYVEESFPLKWMYPYETPFGIIMKVNRNPLPELPEDVFKLDHEFWSKFSSRLCGDWINYDTSVKDIADFVDRTYIHNNYKGYTGDRAFVRDDDAQKAFSKLRSSQAGMYFWRLSPQCPPEYRQKTAATQAALVRETDFAFKQAFAFCPYSPEAVFRYVNFLLQEAQTEEMTGHPEKARHYFDDAILVGKTCEKLDPYNDQVTNLVNNVESYKNSMSQRSEAASQFDSMAEMARTNPANIQNLVMLAGGYIQMQQTGQAIQLLETALAQPNLTFMDAATVAQYCEQLGNHPEEQTALKKVISLAPKQPNAQEMALLGGAYAQLQQTNQAMSLFDAALARPDLNAAGAQLIAQNLAQMGNLVKLETAIQKMADLAPDQPEPRYDLAALQAILGNRTEAMSNLALALDESAKRLAKNPKARDLLDAARTDQRLDSLRSLPGFQKIVPPK